MSETMSEPKIGGPSPLRSRIALVIAVILLCTAALFMFGHWFTKEMAASAARAETARIEREARAQKERAAAAAREAEAEKAWRRANPKASKILDAHPEWSRQVCEAISEGSVIMGMTAEQVQMSWGRPADINRTVTRYGTHEQWVYGSAYLYLDDGKVTSWQD